MSEVPTKFTMANLMGSSKDSEDTMRQSLNGSGGRRSPNFVSNSGEGNGVKVMNPINAKVTRLDSQSSKLTRSVIINVAHACALLLMLILPLLLLVLCIHVRTFLLVVLLPRLTSRCPRLGTNAAHLTGS